MTAARRRRASPEAQIQRAVFAHLRTLGDDRIEAILAEAFADTEFRPMCSEVAA
jgi:hypothetical protein